MNGIDKKYNPFEINTGEIFTDITRDWKKYDRNFLKKIFQEALDITLYQNKKFTVIYKEENKDYINQHRTFIEPRAIEQAANIQNFPIPPFFLTKYNPNDPMESIIYYDQSFVVDRSSNFFDLFFALKLSVTDIMDADFFLAYHLNNNFKNVFGEYFLFLKNICIKYKDFLHDRHSVIVNRFIQEENRKRELEKKEKIEDLKRIEKQKETEELNRLEKQKSIESQKKQEETLLIQKEESDIEKQLGFTLARRVLAIHYMIEQLGVSQYIDKTDKARFIQFLTGKELGAKDIKNTNIYRRVCKLFSESDKATEDDLKFVRDFFEKIGLSALSKQITEEINSKE